MRPRRRASRLPGAIVAIAGLLAAASTGANGQTSIPVGTDTPIPNTAKKVDTVDLTLLDTDALVFEGTAQDATSGYGVLLKAGKKGPYEFTNWIDLGAITLLKKASISGNHLGFLALAVTGAPGIFGVADVAVGGVVQSLGIGDALPGGWTITGFNGIALDNGGAVANVKKQLLGKAFGEGLYYLPDFPATTGMQLVIGTGDASGAGLITEIVDFDVDQKKAMLSVKGIDGAAVFLTNDLSPGSAQTLIADDATSIPSGGLFTGFHKVRYRGKKATFEGVDAALNAGIYYTETPGTGSLGTIAEVGDDVPEAPGDTIRAFESFAANGEEFALALITSAGERGIFSGIDSVGKAKKSIWVGQEIAGKKVADFHLDPLGLGSVVAATEFEDGSSGLAFTPTSSVIPALPGVGLLLLGFAAMTAVVYSARLGRV